MLMIMDYGAAIVLGGTFPGLVRLALWIKGAAETVGTWQQRRRSRIDLAELDRHRLADIGLSRSDALAESAKPFWKL